MRYSVFWTRPAILDNFGAVDGTQVNFSPTNRGVFVNEQMTQEGIKREVLLAG